MPRTAVLFADGCETIEALTVVDVLRRAQTDVSLVSVSGDKHVTTAQGMTLHADASIADYDFSTVDGIVVPGGYPGVTHIIESEAAMAAIEAVYEAEKLVAAICAGPTALAELGIEKDHTLTVYPGCENDYPGWNPPAKPGVYRDRTVLTASGPGFALDFGLAVCDYLCGPQTAKNIASAMLVGR
jgi:4-methyl-5(b-hydroxyethyl)-thiazole monophosphate biosynthesis